MREGNSVGDNDIFINYFNILKNIYICYSDIILFLQDMKGSGNFLGSDALPYTFHALHDLL